MRPHNREFSIDGLPIDIKAEGGLVVAPPSNGSSGRRYEFHTGGWHCLEDLPYIRDGVLPKTRTPMGRVREGNRNNFLYRALLGHAPACDDQAALLDVARGLNANFDRPLSDQEVTKTASGAWKCQVQGRNWVGQPARVSFSVEYLDLLLKADPRHGPDALMLYSRLQKHRQKAAA